MPADPLGKSDGLDALLKSIKSLRDPQEEGLAAQVRLHNVGPVHERLGSTVNLYHSAL